MRIGQWSLAKAIRTIDGKIFAVHESNIIKLPKGMSILSEQRQRLKLLRCSAVGKLAWGIRKSMSDIKARKKYIDAVKGFCIILVLFVHAGGIPFVGRYLFCMFYASLFCDCGNYIFGQTRRNIQAICAEKGKAFAYTICSIWSGFMDCGLHIRKADNP